MAGRLLAEQGHDVVLHARDRARAEQTKAALPQAEAVIEGDVATIAGACSVAEQANRIGRFDAIIHNVAVGYQEPRRIETADGLPHVFAVNSLAPYILTALMEPPSRLVHLSSGLHRSASAHTDDLTWTRRRWNGTAAYSESKLHNLLLAYWIARNRKDVLSNALEPGWVPTRMGGAGAPDDLAQGHLTQVWLAASDDPDARVTGGYFYHLRPRAPSPEAHDADLQDRFVAACAQISGIKLPQSG
jgi:NAD(P)-dependent dehydrogenase (short-subunit alcohol dehydrogenase family)